jgi:RimJ/RimL family protein N-acetyltransferase
MFPEIARDDVFRLETRRLWLRWPRKSDASAVAALAGDLDVAPLTATIPHPYGDEDAGRFILASRDANAQGTALRLALTLKSFPRKFVGMIGVEPGENGPELGFWLGRPFWGRGLLSEAAEAMADAFFRVTAGEALTARVLPENDASRSVLEKVGFAEAERPDMGPGRHADSPVLRFVFPRGDWQALAGDGLRGPFASDRALA